MITAPLLVAALALCVPGCRILAAETNAADSITSLSVMSEDGWWLSIDADGSGRYGYGALPQFVGVAAGTFRFEDVRAQFQHFIAERPSDVAESRATVTFRTDGAASAPTHSLAGAEATITRLFRTARANPRPPAGEIERTWHRRIGRLWRSNPPYPDVLESVNDAGRSPDA